MDWSSTIRQLEQTCDACLQKQSPASHELILGLVEILTKRLGGKDNFERAKFMAENGKNKLAAAATKAKKGNHHQRDQQVT